LQFSLYYLMELDISSLQGMPAILTCSEKNSDIPHFGINVPRSQNHIFYYNLEHEVESMKYYLESIQEDIKKIKASNSNNIF
jgi:hypothetical protein